MAKYTPRLMAPADNNKYFIHYTKGGYNTCILIEGNSVLPNCVGYAQGRLREILNDKEVWSKVGNLACNAEDWIEVAKKNGFKTGKTPKLGAVIVWSKGKKHTEYDGCGHVAVVEKIYDNNDIGISESAYGGREFWTERITKASGYKFRNGYKFEGFIYCGIEFENEKPTNDIVAGQKVVLNNTPCYNSETAKTPYGTKSGTYYLWDTTIRNGRIRITNKSSNVGVAGQVTCWVNMADIGLTSTVATTTTQKPAYQCIYTVKKGDSLWAIATKYLGRGSRYKEIMNLNRLKTDVLSIGQKLKIPNK